MADFLLLIRSGKTAYDQEGRIMGTLDLPLSPSGMEEARSFADRAGRMLDPLPTGVSFASNQIRRLFTSPARCARETAEIVGRRLGLKPQACPGLGNLDHGLWQGLRVDEIESRQPRLHRQWLENPWSVAPPQGGLLDECCDRVAATLERIAKKHGRGGIAVVVAVVVAVRLGGRGGRRGRVAATGCMQDAQARVAHGEARHGQQGQEDCAREPHFRIEYRQRRNPGQFRITAGRAGRAPTLDAHAPRRTPAAAGLPDHPLGVPEPALRLGR